MTQRIRVALVGDYPIDEQSIGGGVESAFAYLVRGLAALDDLDLHVLTFSRSGSPVPIARGGFTIHPMAPFARLELARDFRPYRRQLAARLAGIGPDVVHAQGATDHAYAALRSGYPTVVTVHGIQREDARHQATLQQRTRKHVYGALIERYNVRHARYLIAIGRYVTDYFRRYIRADARLYYIHNAIDETYFEIVPRPSQGIVLYAGRVIRRKRPVDLVEAFAAVAHEAPGSRLRIAGDLRSDPECVAAVRDRISRFGLADRVDLLGSCSELQLLDEFVACDMLVLPSAQETAPMVIAQAMAAGKPIVATPVGAVAEMVEDDRTGFLRPVGDVPALAAAVLRLLRDDELRARFGRAGRAVAERRYRAAAVAQQTAQVYRDIVAERAAVGVPR